MSADNLPRAEDCNCFAVRSAARHVSQFYDQFLVPIGLRNILPLERDGLIQVEPVPTDRRAKDLRLTNAGEKRLQAGIKAWANAQSQFEATFGAKRAGELRAMLRAVTASEFTAKVQAAGH